MTPPKESSVESQSGSDQTLQSESTSNLFHELKAMRRADGIFDDRDRMISIDEADQTDESLLDRPPTEIPVRIRTHANEQAKDQLDTFFGVQQQATPAETLAQIRTEASMNPTQEQGNNSLAQNLIDREAVPLENLQIPQKITLAEVRDVITGARSVDELRDKITPHLAEYNLLEVPEAEGTEIWYAAMPGNREAGLILEVINQEKTRLEKRSSVERARHAAGRAFGAVKETRQVLRERELMRKEIAQEKLLARKDRSDGVKQRLEEDALLEEAYAELADFDRKKAKEAEDKALMGPDSFDDYVQQEMDKVIEPIKAEIRRVQEMQNRLMRATERMPLHDRKDLEAQNAHELDKLYKKAAAERRKVLEKTAEDRKGLTKGLREQAAAIAAFEDDLKADTYSYVPDKNMNPEMAALIAGANGAFVEGETDPIFEDEYDVPHEDKAHPTRMQRLVYKTENPSLFIIEDWDKTSGKLKRQSFVKGAEASILVTAKENGTKRLSRGKKNIELSNKVYEKLGPISPASVAADADTSSSDGYSSYVRNLTRAGGVSVDKARELADPLRKKNKRTEGFIALLTKSLEQNLAKK